MSSRANRERAIMAKEQAALRSAFAETVRLSEREGLHPGKAWLMFLDQRLNDLDCQKAEVLEWMARAIDALNEEKEASRP